MLSGHFQFDLNIKSLVVDFHIPLNEVTILYGKSGSGKTQLLRCLSGLSRPHHALIQFNQTIWQNDSHGIFIPPHKRRIGFVFQHPILFPHLSALDNLCFGYKRLPPINRSIQLKDVIQGLELAHFIDSPTRVLSGGERQRVAIGAALLTSPHLLLMDEPITSIDEQGKKTAIAFLKSIQSKYDITILYVSHSEEERILFGQNFLHLNAGALHKLS